jgi:threonine aldolase
MANAEVGDDVFGEDPTVHRLEDTAARMVGKEAGLLVTSGTMGNLAALLAHCGRGDEMILGDQAHTFMYEQGGSAALGGIHPRPLPNQPDGTIELDAIDAAVRGDDAHFPRTRLICLENSHNRCGGAVLTSEYTTAVKEIADRHDLSLHLDGARIFNAAAALGTGADQLTGPADSVTFCLSKGLAAPVGSVLCGSRSFIARARRTRKVLGGGMRQAGVLAAAGLVALETMVDRLVDDHANAQLLAKGLAQLPGVQIDPGDVLTNIVIFELHRDDLTPPELVERLEPMGVKLFAIGGLRMRAVTHYQVTSADIEWALSAFEAALSG